MGIGIISKLDGYRVISATTDGVLYSSPLSSESHSIEDMLFNPEVINEKFSGSIVSALESGDDSFIKAFQEIDVRLYSELVKYPSIRLLQASRGAWGFDSFIEVKHVATEVTNMKTRGQIGFYRYKGKKYPTVLAKAGNKIDGDKREQAERLLELYHDDDIQYNDVKSLASLRTIMDKNDPIDDLVSIKTRVKVNTDYDYKRKPESENSTLPFISIAEANLYRGCAKNLRKKNIKALPHRVLYATHLAKSNVRHRGSPKEFLIRHFLKALMQGVKPFPPLCNISQQDVADILEDVGVTLSKVKDASSRYPFVFNTIENTASNRKLIKYLLKKLNLVDIYTEVLDILIFKGLSNANDIF